MLATALVAAALVAAPQSHPCRAPVAHGPAVPAPIVLWTSCGSFRLAPDGKVTQLRRHWLARHGSGTGRRYGAHLNIRRTRPGRFVLVLRGRVVWRSTDLHPRDGDSVAFGPHEFAFASYRRGVFVTDLDGPERLVARGRGLNPYTFTSSGDLIITGHGSIMLVSPTGTILRRFAYRLRNGYGFDELSNTLYYVTPAGRLAATIGTQVALKQSITRVDGMISLARPGLLVFSGGHSFTVARRNGSIVAQARWRSPRLSSDSGVAVSRDGRSYAFRLSDAHPGSRSSTATIYVLRAGAPRARAIYRHGLGPSGCAVGAGLTWHGSTVLYSSSDGTVAIIDTRRNVTVNLTAFAKALPHRSRGERALAAWRSDFTR